MRLPNGSEAVVVGIHLYATAEERLAQARTVVEAFADEEAPVILAGDFNSRPGSPVMRLFEEQWANPDKGEDRLTIPSDDPRSEIDFILYRTSGAARVIHIDVVDEPLVSDHRPLFLDLELGR